MVTSMKTCFIALLALGAIGCHSRALNDPSATLLNDLGAVSFPIGTYTSCAQGVHNPNGNLFLNTAGFQSGAVLTLTGGGSVTATYVDQNHVTQSLSFTATTGISATLAQPGQVMGGFSSLCVLGPGNEKAYPATMNVTAGALTYDAGMVFVTLTGGLQSDAGECGTLAEPEAAFWVVCEHRQDGGAPAATEATTSVAPLPVGQHSCNSQVETYEPLNGMTYFSGGGGAGTLTLVQDGAKVSATYAGDPFVAGTLRFGLTSGATASAEAGQTLMSPCTTPVGASGPSPMPEPLPIAAGSLNVVGSTLFVSFAGSMGAGSSCLGAQVTGSIICSN